MQQAVYKIDRKGKKTKLSQKAGMNSALFSPTMKYYINTYTNLDTPAVITLNDNEGKPLKTLVTNDALKQKLAQIALPKKEFFKFKTTEGVELNGWMTNFPYQHVYRQITDRNVQSFSEFFRFRHKYILKK